MVTKLGSIVWTKRGWRRISAALLLCGLLTLAACGGSGGATAETADAENVDIGAPIQAGDWQLELLQPPEKTKVIGSGDITYQAEGTFLVVFAKVTNNGDSMQLVGRNLFAVRDGAGQEYDPVKSAVQVAFVLEHGMETSLDSPLDASKSRDSVIVFDVPAEASNLVLAMDGTEDTLRLGF